MANPSTPFGFVEYGLIDGISPNFGVYTGQLSAANANSIYGGDVAAVISGGYFDVAAVVGGGAPIGGIFLPHFSWQSKSAGMRVRNRAWLGQTADISGGTVECKIIVNPYARMKIRSAGLSGAAVTQTNIGQNANFTKNGLTPGNNLVSVFALDDSTLGSGASLPFKVVDVVQTPESDPTSLYNIVIVQFNNLTQP